MFLLRVSGRLGFRPRQGLTELCWRHSIDELKLKAGQSPAILSANILLLIVSPFRSFLNFMLIQTAIQSKLVIFVAVLTQCL